MYDDGKFIRLYGDALDLRIKKAKFKDIAAIERVRWRLVQVRRQINVEYATIESLFKLIGGKGHVRIKMNQLMDQQERYHSYLWRVYYTKGDGIGWDWCDDIPEAPLYEAFVEEYLNVQNRVMRYSRRLRVVDYILDQAILAQLGHPHSRWPPERIKFIINGREYFYNQNGKAIWEKGYWPDVYIHERVITINGD